MPRWWDRPHGLSEKQENALMQRLLQIAVAVYVIALALLMAFN